jgi:uncharacterized circularly permuted ATP-grasp superfamily protein
MFLSDIYHSRDILRAKIVPDDLIFQNPVFRPEMNGQDVPHDVYVHIAESTSSASTMKISTCWKTMRARRPAYPTCWKIAKS